MRHRRRVTALLMLAVAGACARAASSPSPSARTAAPAPRPAAPTWEGTYDLIGRGVPGPSGPEDRPAVIAITRAVAGYGFSMVEGPPGRATSVQTVGDSLIVEYELQDTPTPLRLALAFADRNGPATGERAVAGEWMLGADRGAVTGKRRP